MYCSKCNKEISDSSKFCKFCGNEIKEDKLNEIINIEKDNKYVIKKSYGLIIFLCIILVPLTLSICMYSLLSGIAIGFTVLLAIGSVVVSTTNIIFKCPNCNEEIQISQNKLEDINQMTSTCKCPKCNKDLIFNSNDKIVSVNSNSDNKENRETISTSQLEELYNLKTKGIITEEEFESKKKQFLNCR